jgi:hypothetical protein
VLNEILSSSATSVLALLADSETGSVTTKLVANIGNLRAPDMVFAASIISCGLYVEKDSSLSRVAIINPF